MKLLDSNSISESFGLSNMELDELYFINGGSGSSTGVGITSIGHCANAYIPPCHNIGIPSCVNIGYIPPLSGNIVGPIYPPIIVHIGESISGINIKN